MEHVKTIFLEPKKLTFPSSTLHPPKKRLLLRCKLLFLEGEFDTQVEVTTGKSGLMSGRLKVIIYGQKLKKAFFLTDSLGEKIKSLAAVGKIKICGLIPPPRYFFDQKYMGWRFSFLAQHLQLFVHFCSIFYQNPKI